MGVTVGPMQIALGPCQGAVFFFPKKYPPRPIIILLYNCIQNLQGKCIFVVTHDYKQITQ